MSDYRFSTDDHRLNCDPDAENCGVHDFDNADWVEVDGNMFVRERTCHDVCIGREFECSICGSVSHVLVRDEALDWHLTIPAHCPVCGAKVVEQ